MYRCGSCNRAFERTESGAVRCPYCGSRTLFKLRSEVVHKVKAR